MMRVSFAVVCLITADVVATPQAASRPQPNDAGTSYCAGFGLFGGMCRGSTSVVKSKYGAELVRRHNIPKWLVAEWIRRKSYGITAHHIPYYIENIYLHHLRCMHQRKFEFLFPDARLHDLSVLRNPRGVGEVDTIDVAAAVAKDFQLEELFWHTHNNPWPSGEIVLQTAAGRHLQNILTKLHSNSNLKSSYVNEFWIDFHFERFYRVQYFDKDDIKHCGDKMYVRLLPKYFQPGLMMSPRRIETRPAQLRVIPANTGDATAMALLENVLLENDVHDLHAFSAPAHRQLHDSTNTNANINLQAAAAAEEEQDQENEKDYERYGNPRRADFDTQRGEDALDGIGGGPAASYWLSFREITQTFLDWRTQENVEYYEVAGGVSAYGMSPSENHVNEPRVQLFLEQYTLTKNAAIDMLAYELRSDRYKFTPDEAFVLAKRWLVLKLYGLRVGGPMPTMDRLDEIVAHRTKGMTISGLLRELIPTALPTSIMVPLAPFHQLDPNLMAQDWIDGQLYNFKIGFTYPTRADVLQILKHHVHFTNVLNELAHAGHAVNVLGPTRAFQAARVFELVAAHKNLLEKRLWPSDIAEQNKVRALLPLKLAKTNEGRDHGHNFGVRARKLMVDFSFESPYKCTCCDIESVNDDDEVDGDGTQVNAEIITLTAITRAHLKNVLVDQAQTIKNGQLERLTKGFLAWNFSNGVRHWKTTRDSGIDRECVFKTKISI